MGAGIIEQNNWRGMLTSQIFSDSLLELIHKLSELDLVGRITCSKWAVKAIYALTYHE